MSGHQWKETWYFGGHIGINSFNDDDGYFGGVMGFYHTQLVHNHPSMLSDYISQYGIIGTGNYLREPDSDLVLTLQYSKGLWVDQTALLQVAVGPLWSESYEHLNLNIHPSLLYKDLFLTRLLAKSTKNVIN